MGRIVFFGNERLATGVTTTAPTLQALIAAGHEVVAVVSNYERGTSRNARELEIKAVADAHNIPVLLPEKPADIIDQLKSLNTEVAVLVAYGRIVPQSIIDIFPKGIVNIHPSLLPLHRGPTPIESVILDGSTVTGVSVMQLVKAMDAGPVFGQTVIELNGNETKQELADRLLEIGGKMVVELLPCILDGSVVAKPQDDSKATYDKMIVKDDGRIDWTKTAIQYEREIRAFAGWPKSTVIIAKKDVIITGARILGGPIYDSESLDNRVPLKAGTVVGNGKDSISIQCGGDQTEIIEIQLLKPAGKKEMSAKDFLAGYGKNL